MYTHHRTTPNPHNPIVNPQQGYRDHLVAPDLNHGFREIFDRKGFLAAHAEDRSLRSFLGKVRWTLSMCV